MSRHPSDERAQRYLTRSQLAERIANGETLVLRGRSIYKLDSWLSKHPGGELAILHFVGRDAGDEIEVYHSEDTLRRMAAFAIATLSEEDWLGTQRKDGAFEGYRPLIPPIQLGYRNGRLDHPPAGQHAGQQQSKENATESVGSSDTSPVADTGEKTTGPFIGQLGFPADMPIPVSLLEPSPDHPETDAVKERAISSSFKELHAEVKHAGLYELRPVGYLRECARYVCLAGAAFYLWFTANGQTVPLLASSVFLGLFWHQLTFTAHDAGHTGITHNYVLDRSIGILIADLIGGLSIGWWCDNHDVHHLVTNHPEHDPDIQHLPFFAISPRFFVAPRDSDDRDIAFAGLWSSYYRRVLHFDAPAKAFLRLQHQLYYVIMSLGRFNLYANSYGFLLFKARRDKWLWLESIALAVFWSWYGVVLRSCPTWKVRIAYLLISHIVTSPLHVQIVLSHFAQSSQDMGLSESFASRQIRTTMDVQCSPSLEFLHGGLHMQVTHHLFPRLPRHNLRECRDRFVRPFAERHGLSYEEYSFIKGNQKVLRVLRDVADQVKLLGKVAAAQARGELRH